MVSRTSSLSCDSVIFKLFTMCVNSLWCLERCFVFKACVYMSSPVVDESTSSTCLHCLEMAVVNSGCFAMIANSTWPWCGCASQFVCGLCCGVVLGHGQEKYVVARRSQTCAVGVDGLRSYVFCVSYTG